MLELLEKVLYKKNPRLIEEQLFKIFTESPSLNLSYSLASFGTIFSYFVKKIYPLATAQEAETFDTMTLGHIIPYTPVFSLQILFRTARFLFNREI